MEIYLAAPWFSPKQDKIYLRVEKAINATNHRGFFPRRECLVSNNSSKQELREAFSWNIRHIQMCDMVVAVTDYKDTGTLFECGCAFMINKPILYYAETLQGRPFNLMLAESAIGVVQNELELFKALEEAVSPRDILKSQYGLYTGRIE